MMGHGFGPGGSFRLTGRREVVILQRKANTTSPAKARKTSIFNFVMNDDKFI